MIGFIYALLSPMFFAATNTIDKFYIDHRIKNSMSFLAIAGVMSTILGMGLGIFLDWQGAFNATLIFPAMTGILMGLEMYVYFAFLKREDVSNSINIMYIYPLLLAVMAYLFLDERLSAGGYFGAGLVIIGIIFLSLNKRINSKNLILVIPLILIVALNEFFVKLSTNNLPEANCVAIYLISSGLLAMTTLINRKIRKGSVMEIKNIGWIFLSTASDMLGTVFLFLASAQLPITIVASIAAIQPLIVILFEGLTDRHFAKIIKDRGIYQKISSAGIIVAGVILIYNSGT